MAATLWNILTILIVMVMASFLTWWFLLGLLNPFIEASVSITVAGVLLVARVPFLLPIEGIRWLISHIHPLVGAVMYLLVGAGVFVLDHFYNTKIFAEDEVTFYKVGILDHTYWVTEIACWIGGFFIFCGLWILIGAFLRLINRLLDRTIGVSIIFYK